VSGREHFRCDANHIVTIVRHIGDTFHTLSSCDDNTTKSELCKRLKQNVDMVKNNDFL
jgi:hypothetical protein